MLSSAENVGVDDASVGVARNPLRDGAPPTGLFYPARCEKLETLLAPNRSPRSLSLHFIERRVSDRSTCLRRVAECDGGLSQSKHRNRLRHSSKHYNPHQRRLDRKRGALLARLRCEACQNVPTAPSKIGRGACLAPCELDPFPRIEVGKNDATCSPSATRGSGRSFRSLRVAAEPSAMSKFMALCPRPRIQRRGRARERRPAPLESEAISETGSSRRRAPVAAYSSSVPSRERLEGRLGPRLFPAFA
jgi:hypothetical protein